MHYILYALNTLSETKLLKNNFPTQKVFKNSFEICYVKMKVN